MSGEPEEEQIDSDSDVALVVDPDEYRETRQLKQIHNAKEKYAELKETEDSVEPELYPNRVQNLIVELEPLMSRLETEVDYLNGVTLGNVVVLEDGTKIEYGSGCNRGGPNSKQAAIDVAISQGKAERQTLTGLKSILGTPGYHAPSVGRTPMGSDGNSLVAEFRYYPPSVCDVAFRYCRKFIAEAGLGIRLTEDKGPAQI